MIKQIKLSHKVLNDSFLDIKLDWKHQLKVVILHWLYYKSHKRNISWSGSYIVLLIGNNKKAAISPAYDDDKYFQCAALIATSVAKHLERISKIEPFINKFNSKGIPVREWWLDKVRENNPKIALNVLSLKIKQILSKNYCDFYFLNYLHSFRKKNQLKEVCGKTFLWRCNVFWRYYDTGV